MPVPLIQLQKRLTIVGKIRMGEKNERGLPTRLSTWRITSPRESLIREAAGLYGGEVKPWSSPAGEEFEVVTTSSVLPILVMPGYSMTQSYELWEGPSKTTRRCDGIEMSDGSPCLCNQEEGDDKCDLHTRLTIALPELTTLLGWRVETKGQNAAAELGGGMQMAESLGGGRPFVPAKLILSERRGQKDGQTVRYVVPVLDLAVGYSQLTGGAKAIEPRHTPVPQITDVGPTLDEALEITEGQVAVQTARSAAPIGPTTEVVDSEPVPVIEDGETPTSPPVQEETVTDPPVSPTTPPEGEVKFISEAQVRRFHTIRRSVPVMTDRAKEIVVEITGQDSSKKIPVDLYDRVIAALEAEGTGQDGLL